MTNVPMAKNTSNALTPMQDLTREDIELLKSTICKGSTDGELKFFIRACNRLRLDPFARQIFAVKRWDSKERREVLSIQVSIDGLRLAAQRTGKYLGQVGPFFSRGEMRENKETGMQELVWYDGWPFAEPPVLAKVGVANSDFGAVLWSQARYAAYVQTNKDGQPTGLWGKMPELMIGKCAEALALRRAFPAELSGAYTPEEMGQARPVTPVMIERIEKMLHAFATLYEQQTGESGINVRYLIEDYCGGKPFEDFDDSDMRSMQALYAELKCGRKQWMDVSDAASVSAVPPNLPMNETRTARDIDAEFSHPPEDIAL